MVENNQYGNAITKPLPYGCKKNLKKFLPLVNLISFKATFPMKIRSFIYSWSILNFIKISQNLLI